jgi:hypothetical protein
MESMPLFPRLKLAAELWPLRGRGVRVPAKLSPADLLEIVRRANDWPAPSPIFRTYCKSSYNYIFQAPVSVAAIVMMLREAFEEARKARKAREALLAVASANRFGMTMALR